MDNYGLALKILRKRFSVTQTELAEKVGVSNHAVSKWENGVNQPDVSTLQTICKIFDITLDQFLRLSSGESEESVFAVEENKDIPPKNEIKESKIFNIKTLFITLITLCFAAIVVVCVFIFQSCNEASGESESTSESVQESQSLESIGESIVLGEEITGTKTEFLNSINSAITLDDGISEYDFTGVLKYNDNTASSLSIKLIVNKSDGEITKYYVKSPSEGVDAYTDFNYVYTTVHGEKVRLNKSAIDLAKYVEDVEKPYSEGDIQELKAYKKGYTTQYVFTFTEEYAKEELKDFLDELNGVILTNCEGIFLLSNAGISEKIILNFTYQGRDYEFVATRQLNNNSNFNFPDFSKYTPIENQSNLLQEIDTAVNSTKNLTNYTKVLYNNETELFRMEKSGQTAKAQALSSEPKYYENGNLYGYSTNYEGAFPCYEKASFDDFYLGATKNVSAKALFALDFSLDVSDVSLVLKKQVSEGVQYIAYLTQSGVEYLKTALDIYLYVYGDITAVYTVKDGVITSVEIIDDGNSYKLTVLDSANVVTPDFSSYGALIDGTNEILDVKTTKVEQYEFCSEAIVDKNTGDVYTCDNVTVRKYGKDHSLKKEYQIKKPSGWSFGNLLGIDWNNIYYSVFESYSRDFFDDNRVYSLNLTTGESSCKASNYSMTQIPVCAVNGVIQYENYHNGLIYEGVSDWNFIYFDSANNILISRNIIDGDEYIGAYDFDTNTFKKEKNDFIWEEWLCGEGYYREQSEDENSVGKYFSYANIGKTNVVTEYLKVVDRHPNRYYESPIDANWQIIKDTAKYTFTTYGVYEKANGNFVYFPKKAEYRFFSGGVHVWDCGLNFFLDDMYWYTFYY